jgi:hypothetical protein
MPGSFDQYMPQTAQAPEAAQGAADFGKYMQESTPQVQEAPQSNDGVIDKINAFGGGVASSVGLGPGGPVAQAVGAPAAGETPAGQAMSANPNTAMAGRVTGALAAGGAAGVAAKGAALAMETGAVNAETASFIANNFTAGALSVDGDASQKLEGGAAGLVGGAAFATAGTVIKDAIGAGLLPAKIQGALDTISSKLMGFSTNEAAGQAAANTWNTGMAVANKQFETFRGMPGNVTGTPLASQAQSILDKYTDSLSGLQKQVLKDTINVANGATDLAGLHDARKVLSNNYSKFTANAVTSEMSKDLRGLGEFAESHLQDQATKNGALDAYNNANAIWKGTILPMRSYGMDAVASALDPAAAVKDPHTANMIMDTLLNSKTLPNRVNDINGFKAVLNKQGQNIVDAHIVNKVLSDVSGNMLSIPHLQASLAKWNPTLSKVLGPEALSTMSGLNKAVEAAHGLNSAGRFVDNNLTKVGAIATGATAAGAGHPLVALGMGTVYGIKAFSQTAAGQIALQGLDKFSGTKAAQVLNEIIGKGLTISAAQMASGTMGGQ